MKRVVALGIAAAGFAGPVFGQDAAFLGLKADPSRAVSASGFGLRAGSADPMRAGFAGIQRDLAQADAATLPAGIWAPGSAFGPGPAFAYPAEAGALMDYRLNRWTFSSSLRQGLGERATAVDVGARYGFSLAPRHSLALLGSVGLGNHSAIRPLAMDELDLLRLRPPGLGFRDVGAQLSLQYTFDQTWYVNTVLGYSRLLGDPMDIGTPDRNVTSVGAMFGYRF